MGSYFQGGSPANYTIGAARFWFNRLADEASNPKKYEGWFDVGNIVDHNLEQPIEVLDHFTTRSGTRTKDRSLVRQISEEIVFTLDELSVENLRMFLRGGAVTDVAAAAAGGTVVDEIGQMIEDKPVIMAGGKNPTVITVKSLDGLTTYVLDTDYTVVDIIGGYKAIQFKDGGTLVEGDFVKIGYKYDILAHKKFAPATNTELKGRGLMFGVSDTGQEFKRSWELIQIEPEGQFGLNDQDWSSFQLRVKVLDNSDSVPSAPFGLFEHYGKGTNL